MLGLYIHIPFCRSKCRYCDFYSMTGSERLINSYIAALKKQIEEYASQMKTDKIDSIYIGGGTPTSVDSKILVDLIKLIKKKFKVIKNSEFTVEVNPGTVDLAVLKKLYKLGVNRLSIGMQSSSNSELRILGRRHTYRNFAECIGYAKTAGFENINADIMYGIPSQTSESLNKTIKRAVTLGVTHISLYGLKIEPDTYFYEHENEFNFPSEEDEVNMYFKGIKLLESHGYKQYEISNFSKDGYKCYHNLKYWNLEEYLGLGVSAHSYYRNYRFSFCKDIKKYINHFSYNEESLEKLDMFDLPKYTIFDDYMEIKPHERIGEYIMLQLRLCTGINTMDFLKKFRKDFDSIYYEKIRPYIKNGLIVKTETGYKFSVEGMYVSNYILSRII